MRVTILTHYYPPEGGAPQVRLSALAHALAARGASVTVHTGFPHYPEGRVQAPYSNRPWLVEREGAVRIVRSAVAALPNRGFAPRLIDHASFAASALATAAVAGRADVVLAESPPLFLAGAAVPYARVKRAALVLNVSDLWPESAIQLGALRDRRAIAAARALERLAYRASSAIVVPTQGIAAALAGRAECAGKVEHVAPAVDVAAFERRGSCGTCGRHRVAGWLTARLGPGDRHRGPVPGRVRRRAHSRQLPWSPRAAAPASGCARHAVGAARSDLDVRYARASARGGAPTPAGVALVRLKSGFGIHVARTGSRGHHSVSGAPSVLVDCVERVDRAS